MQLFTISLPKVFYTRLKKIVKVNKEKEKLSEHHSSLDGAEEADRNLIENERFVKKLEIQIDIIKKIIDPETNPVHFDFDYDAEMKQDIWILIN